MARTTRKETKRERPEQEPEPRRPENSAAKQPVSDKAQKETEEGLVRQKGDEMVGGNKRRKTVRDEKGAIEDVNESIAEGKIRSKRPDERQRQEQGQMQEVEQSGALMTSADHNTGEDTNDVGREEKGSHEEKVVAGSIWHPEPKPLVGHASNVSVEHMTAIWLEGVSPGELQDAAPLDAECDASIDSPQGVLSTSKETEGPRLDENEEEDYNSWDNSEYESSSEESAPSCTYSDLFNFEGTEAERQVLEQKLLDREARTIAKEKKMAEDFDRIKEREVHEAYLSLEKDLAEGKSVPIGILHGDLPLRGRDGRWELHSAELYSYYYHFAHRPQVLSFTTFCVRPEDSCRPGQLAGEFHARPEGYHDIIPFDVPTHASLTPVILKTSYEGIDLEVTFLGNGYLLVGIKLCHVLGGSAQERQKHGDKVIVFSGIWTPDERYAKQVADAKRPWSPDSITSYYYR